MNLSIIADYKCHTGEGCLWHTDEQALYWVDIPQGKLFRYDPATQQHSMIYHDRPIGGYTIQENGDLLCFRDKGNIVLLNSKGGYIKTIIDSIPELSDTRFNDVVATPAGGVFAGTMSCDALPGRLYHFKTDGSHRSILENQGTPNGMGFSPDVSTMYYQDSRQEKLWSFSYDQSNDRLDNQTLLRTAHESGDRGRGDGMCVDAQGELWSARWDGNCVIHCTADGSPKKHYEIPAQCITSACFGGEHLDELYLTSAGGDDKQNKGDAAGALFKLSLGIKGKAEFRSRI